MYIITLCLEIKDIKKIDSTIKFCNEAFSKFLNQYKHFDNIKLSMRKEGINLFLDFKIKKTNFISIFEDLILNIDLPFFYFEFKNNLI